MRPTPIPDDEVWEGFARRIISPPGGDLTGEIRGVEALVGPLAFDGEMIPAMAVRIVLEDGDLERLQNGEPFWLVQLTNRMVPWSLSFGGP